MATIAHVFAGVHWPLVLKGSLLYACLCAVFNRFRHIKLPTLLSDLTTSLVLSVLAIAFFTRKPDADGVGLISSILFGQLIADFAERI